MMTLNNVVIAGGTGFIGRRLAQALVRQGTKVTVLTRNAESARSKVGQDVKCVTWCPSSSGQGQGQAGWVDALRNADGVVNLCGEPIVRRWTTDGKKSITDSRVIPTECLVGAMEGMSESERPKCLLNASAVGYYGVEMAYDTDVTETSAKGSDFAAELCATWEGSGSTFRSGRLVTVRLGIVLGHDGGALAKMIPAYQLFVGGPLGSGRQWMPWVHVDDVVKIMTKALRDPSMDGVYNCTAPTPVTMATLCDALSQALKRPNLFQVPEVVLKTALGDASIILLKGQKALPRRLLQETDYQFEYPDVYDAMRAVANQL